MLCSQKVSPRETEGLMTFEAAGWHLGESLTLNHIARGVCACAGVCVQKGNCTVCDVPKKED